MPVRELYRDGGDVIAVVGARDTGFGPVKYGFRFVAGTPPAEAAAGAKLLPADSLASFCGSHRDFQPTRDAAAMAEAEAILAKLSASWVDPITEEQWLGLTREEMQARDYATVVTPAGEVQAMYVKSPAPADAPGS